MIVYDLLCEACGKLIGTLSYESEPSEETLKKQSAGYICSECVNIEEE